MTKTVLPISNAQAKCFIKRLKEEDNYLIPTAWLFEDGIIQMLSIPNLSGIRFYSAINNAQDPNDDKLTLIMVPVQIDGNGVYKDLENEVIYEFSDMCPYICNAGTMGTFAYKSQIGVQIPRAWYIPRIYFDAIINSNPTTIVGVRIYQYKLNGVLDFKFVPVIKENGTYTDLHGPIIQGVSLFCFDDNSPTCDISSSLYLAKNCD